MKSFLPVILACLFIGTSSFTTCGSDPTPNPVVEDTSPIVDSTPVADSSTCTAATCECATANMLANFPQCPDANDAAYCGPNGIGEDFLTTCNTAVNVGAHVPLTCLVSAKTCKEWKACK